MGKNYIRGAFRKLNSKYGEMLLASIFVDDLLKIQNDKGYANIVITERRQEDEYKNTHLAYENDWKPDAKAAAKKKRVDSLNPPDFEESVNDKSASDNSDDLPF